MTYIMIATIIWLLFIFSIGVFISDKKKQHIVDRIFALSLGLLGLETLIYMVCDLGGLL